MCAIFVLYCFFVKKCQNVNIAFFCRLASCLTTKKYKFHLREFRIPKMFNLLYDIRLIHSIWTFRRNNAAKLLFYFE